MNIVELQEFATVALLNTFLVTFDQSLIRSTTPVSDSAGLITKYVVAYLVEVPVP